MDIALIPEMLKACHVAQDSLLMKGIHGIGKSSIVSQYAKDEDFHFEPLFLSQQEVGDLIGNPTDVKDEEGNTIYTSWTVPAWLKRMRDSGKKCILLLDELNRAQSDVLQSALQLVLEGRLHEHELPVVDGLKTQIVAAINPPGDYQVAELDPALLDRFLEVDVELVPSSWLRWARSAKLNPIVTKFITENPSRLQTAPATARSWTKLAHHMDNLVNIHEDVLFSVISGKIGPAIGGQFFTFLKDFSFGVTVEEIEDIVDRNKDLHVEKIAEVIAEYIQDCEAIKKTELVEQLSEKYLDKEEMLPLLATLYSLEMEVCVSYLKSIQKSDYDNYRNLAKYDGVMNNKQLFARIHSKANNV